MEISTAPSAQEFLARTAQFRAREPYLTNVMGSVAVGVVEGRAYDSCHWWIAEDAGDVVGAAIRTAPYNVLIAPMPAEVNARVARAVADVFPELPGLSGPLNQADAFIDVLQPRTVVRTMDETVYVLDALRAGIAEGHARRAQPSDEELLSAWIYNFLVEAGMPLHNPQAGVKRLLEVGWLWEVGGTPVSLSLIHI